MKTNNILVYIESAVNEFINDRKGWVTKDEIDYLVIDQYNRLKVGLSTQERQKLVKDVIEKFRLNKLGFPSQLEQEAL